MPAGGYLALLWRGGTDLDIAAKNATTRLEAEGAFALAADRPGLRLWTCGRRLPVRKLGDAVIVGDLLQRSPATCASRVGGVVTQKRLASEFWGRYVAFWPGMVPVLYRDPSGLIDSLHWQIADGLFVVSSDLRSTPPWLRPRRLSLNWERVARYLANPTAHTTAALFDDMAAVGPGELQLLDGHSLPELVWRPSRFAAATSGGPPELAAELVRQIDQCTAALAGLHHRLIVEISGGLDSSIVATSLAATGQAGRVAAWLNRAGAPDGDEQCYARSIADRLGVDLTGVVKPLAPLVEDDFAELADATWPAMNGVEAWRDRDDVARLGATGADAFVCGQGGDAVFFQIPTPLIVSDEMRAKGLAALGSPLLPEVARRSRQSVWSVLRHAIGPANRRRSVMMTPSRLVSREIRAAVNRAAHRWGEDALEAGLPPAKAMQIAGIANHHVYHGDSRRRRVAETLFPLLAQPVVELCLSISIPDLTRGGDDRPFARAAFADRLPRSVLERRRKGAQSRHFAQLIAASLPTLGPMLLDGCLSDAGVLDRTAVERMLDRRQLIWEPRSSEILWAATAEAWVRHWQRRTPDAPSAPRWSFRL